MCGWVIHAGGPANEKFALVGTGKERLEPEREISTSVTRPKLAAMAYVPVTVLILSGRTRSGAS